MEHGTITRKLSSVFEELTDAFGPMYIKSDFEKQIAKLLKAKTERQGVLAQLYDMFDRSGVAYEMNKGNSYYQKLVQQMKLPHLTELEDRILRELYDRYTAWQSPEAYLERIVSKLEEPEDHRPGDTLRLRILRRFIRKGNYLADMTEVKAGKNGKQTLIRKCGGQKEIEDYITQKTGIKKPDVAAVLEHLDDGVFSRLEQAQERAKQSGEEKIAAAVAGFRELCREYWELEVTAGQTALLMDSQKMKRVETELNRRASEEMLNAFVRAWLAADGDAAKDLTEKLDELQTARKTARGKKGVAVGADVTAHRAKALEDAQRALEIAAAEHLGLELTPERLELLMSKRRFGAMAEAIAAGEGEQPLTEKWENMLSEIPDAGPEETVALLVRWCGLWNSPENAGIRKTLQKAMDSVRKAREYAHEIRQTATALDGSVGLLRLVDDLAGGMFREGGVTRRSLYLFAMVYDMPFYTGAEGTIPTETDLEKNLFRDYYRNNLMRYLSEEFREKLSETELDPAGMGINYKNFAEMCYLYYIARRDLTAPQRIEGATRMIQRLRESQKGAPRGANADLGTQVFRGRVVAGDEGGLFVEDLLCRPPEVFEDFLRENYDCNIQRGYTMGVLDLETEQNTAFRLYQEILELLKEELRDAGAEPGRELEGCGYGLCFADSGAYGKQRFEAGANETQLESFHSLLEEYNSRNDARRLGGNRTLAERLGVSEAEAAPFRELLMGVNRLLGRVVTEEVSYQSTAEERTEQSAHVIRALSVTSPRRMTRASMITAYYYYYNAMRERNRQQEIKSFRSFYEDFTWDLDYYLTESGYLPMSSKNLFDVLVAFSAYTYYNIG